MSATQQVSPFRIEIGDQVYLYRLVKASAATIVHNTATATDVPLGTVAGMDNTGASGETGSVRCIKQGGTHKVVAAGAITAGADIYAADDGKVQALPATSGTYRRLGFALQAASADGSIIEAWLTPEGGTDTVTGS